MRTFSRRSGVRAEAVDAQALADAVADRGPRVEAGVRVLEDDLHPPAVRLEGGALERRELDAVELDRARRRLDEAQEQPPDRRLAAARLADQPEGLAAADVEADAVDRLDGGDRPLQHPAADREVLDEVADLDQRPVGIGWRAGRQAGRAGHGHWIGLAHRRRAGHAPVAELPASGSFTDGRGRRGRGSCRGSGTPRASW